MSCCIIVHKSNSLSLKGRGASQGSPKCGIVGGDKIEVRGGSSKRVREHAPPGNFENLQHL